jgi:hypothetical protein
MANDVLPGRWVGEYLDAYGYRSNLEFDLKSDGSRIAGRVQMELRTEDEPVVISGSAEGEVTDGRGTVVLRLEGVDEELKHEFHVRDAGTHAQQALCGIAESTEDSGFGGGVWIVWAFKRERG